MTNCFSVVLSAVIIIGMIFPISTNAVSNVTPLEGLFYEWNSNGNKYPFSAATGDSTSGRDTYGSFAIDGSITETTENNGVKSFLVNDDNVSFKYMYTDSMISDNDSGDVNWHITDDNSKKVDDISLESKIKSGVIIIQTSLDGVNWISDEVYTDVFETTPIQTNPVYTTNSVQLMNGTYYRFIVAYKMRRLIGTTGVWVFRSSQYEYLERAEVYEFYLKSESSYNYTASQNNRWSIGSVVNAGSHNGFDSTDVISTNDPHYGWTLGRFFVRGYTDKNIDDPNNPIFLKTTNDRVELFFSLEQDINCLNGNADLIINDDRDGTDSYFQTDRNIDFERGALIVRHTNYEGVQGEPQIYTNFLEANTRAGANTRIALFEEGDYEVALDYEICDQDGFDSYENYRIFFKFSIRNGNTMVFPFDVGTRSELRSMSITPNGFYLDLAKSRYLHITVKKFVLNDSGNGLDPRNSYPVSDQSVFDEEGIYLIYAVNDYAPQTSSRVRKIICVGNNPALINYFNTNVVHNPSILTED